MMFPDTKHLSCLGTQIDLLACSPFSGGGDGGDEHNRKKTDGFQTLWGSLPILIRVNEGATDNSHTGKCLVIIVISNNSNSHFSPVFGSSFLGSPPTFLHLWCGNADGWRWVKIKVLTRPNFCKFGNKWHEWTKSFKLQQQQCYCCQLVLKVLLCLIYVISHDCRPRDGSGGMWPIHSVWQPDLWPSTGSNKCHCQGSSWCLHTGTVTSFFYVSPQSEVLPACHMTAHYSPLLSSWAPSWIPNTSKSRYVWQWTYIDLVPAALLLGSDVYTTHIRLLFSLCPAGKIWLAGHECLTTSVSTSFSNRKLRLPRRLRLFSQDASKAL